MNNNYWLGQWKQRAETAEKRLETQYDKNEKLEAQLAAMKPLLRDAIDRVRDGNFDAIWKKEAMALLEDK